MILYLHSMNMKSKAYLISLQMYADACRKGMMRKVTLEQYSEVSYEKVTTGHQERFVPESLTIIETNLFRDYALSPRAHKLVIQIIGELYMNNALWYFNQTKSTADSTAIKELREKGVLYKTEDAHIHFVNPALIRRGSKPGVLACTTKELESVSRVGIENIRNLGYKENKVNMNLLDMHTL